VANSLQHYVELASTRHSKCYLSKHLTAFEAKLSRNFYTVAERNGSVRLLTAPQRQSRDAANPDATQPDNLEKHALRFVVFFVQLTNIINGKSANTKT
jgi:hypothetical protein